MTRKKSNVSFKPLPGLDEAAGWDPEGSARVISDEAQKSREFWQGQILRWVAFCGILVIDVCAFAAWLYLMWENPEVSSGGDQKTIFLLWGVKTSLATVTILGLMIGTLRFAIRCYGHHQQCNGGRPDSDSVASAVGKAVETAIKTAQGTGNSP